MTNNDAQAEAFFRTLKYRPGYPGKGFDTLERARVWVKNFVHWYNHEHRHSALKFVTPTQRHAGDDHAVLRAREQLYEQARARNPERWSGAPRNWTRPGAVWLNPAKPERKTLLKTG